MTSSKSFDEKILESLTDKELKKALLNQIEYINLMISVFNDRGFLIEAKINTNYSLCAGSPNNVRFEIDEIYKKQNI